MIQNLECQQDAQIIFFFHYQSEILIKDLEESYGAKFKNLHKFNGDYRLRCRQYCLEEVFQIFGFFFSPASEYFFIYIRNCQLPCKLKLLVSQLLMQFPKTQACEQVSIMWKLLLIEFPPFHFFSRVPFFLNYYYIFPPNCHSQHFGIKNFQTSIHNS